MLHFRKPETPWAITGQAAQSTLLYLETAFQKLGSIAPPNMQRRSYTWDKIILAEKRFRLSGSAIYFCANFRYNVSTKGMIP